MAERTIPQRDAITVKVGQRGTIEIHQDSGMGDVSIVEVHPDDIDVLVSHLKACHREAAAANGAGTSSESEL